MFGWKNRRVVWTKHGMLQRVPNEVILDPWTQMRTIF